MAGRSGPAVRRSRLRGRGGRRLRRTRRRTRRRRSGTSPWRGRGPPHRPGSVTRIVESLAFIAHRPRPTGARRARRYSPGSSRALYFSMPSGPLLIGPVEQLRPLAPVLVERHSIATRVGDPLHVHHNHRADTRMLGEAGDQAGPLAVPWLDDPAPPVETHDQRACPRRRRT